MNRKKPTFEAWPQLVAAFLLLGACSSSNSSILASGTIGPDGGTIRVDTGDLAGTSILVPAGSLTQTVTISMKAGTISLKSGVIEIGKAALYV